MSNEFKDTNITTGNNSPVTINQIIGGQTPRRTPLERPPRAEHFTGREQELRKLIADLQSGQVVTLCGPGGTGKTALAAEAIWSLVPGEKPAELFPDGIIFHDFNTLPQAAQALEAIALAFGEEPRPTPGEAAQRALAGRAALLVLDGAEACDDLGAVLAERGHCGVLVTSRSHRDAVAGFTDIPTLSLEEAVSLLRAWSGSQSIEQHAAERICLLVGGLPLAVRLIGRFLGETGEEAAAYLEWLEGSPLEALDLGKRPDESVPLLMERSLAQLSSTAFQALGVAGTLAFASFSREVMAAALGLGAGELLKTMGELVNYGLLLRLDKRFQCAQVLVHSYARQRCAPEVNAVTRLAGYFATLAEEQSQQGMEGYARLDLERPHLLRVQQACLEKKKWALVQHLTWAAEAYLDLRGYWTELVSLLEAGLAAARASEDQYDQGAFLGNLGNTYTSLGERRKAIEFFEQALIMDREIGDRRAEGDDLGNLGLAYAGLGETEKAIQHYEQAQAIAQETDDRGGAARHLGNLGNAYAGLGETKKAIQHHEQALRIVRELGDRRGETADLGNLGLAYAALGETQKAIEYYEQALPIAREIGDRRAEGADLGNLGLAYADLGETEKAIQYHEQALRIAREIGDRPGEGVDLANLGQAYADLGETEKAIETYEQALGIARQIGDRRGEGNRLGNLGNAYADLGETGKSIQYYEQALPILREIGDRRGEANCMGNLGNSYADLGEAHKSIEYYEQALRIAREIGDRLSESNHLRNLGDAFTGLGETQKAIQTYEQALSIDREISNRAGEEMTLGNLGNAYANLGERRKAIEFYEQALRIAGEIGNRRDEGGWLGNLGLSYEKLEEPDQARTCWQQALKIFQEIEDPSAAEVQQWLEGLRD